MPPTIPSPSQLATQAHTKLHTLVTLTRAGIVHPERPDRLWNTARALLKTRPAMYITRPNPNDSEPSRRAGRVSASAMAPRSVQNSQTTTARTIAP